MSGRRRVRDHLQRLAEPDRTLAACTGAGSAGPRASTGRLACAARPAHDVDVLTRPGERLAERPAVPALDDLRPAHADAEQRAALGEPVERHARASPSRSACGPRSARCPCRAEAPCRRRGDGSERGEGVRAPRLAGPDRVEAEVLGGARGVDQVARRAGLRGPVPELEAELEVPRHAGDGTPARRSAASVTGSPST